MTALYSINLHVMGRSNVPLLEDRTLATMSPQPHLVNIPTMVGGQGPDAVRTFYAKRLIGQFFPPESEGQKVARLPMPGLWSGSYSGRPVFGSTDEKTFCSTNGFASTKPMASAFRSSSQR